MSAIAAIVGRKIDECKQEVLSRHGGAGVGQEAEVRDRAAREVCAEGFSMTKEEYHRNASDRFEDQLPKTRDEMQRKEALQRAIVGVTLRIVLGPLALLFGK